MPPYLAFYVGAGNQMQTLILVREEFYQLSHLPSPLYIPYSADSVYINLDLGLLRSMATIRISEAGTLECQHNQSAREKLQWSLSIEMRVPGLRPPGGL